MKRFLNCIAEFAKKEDGPTAVEYAVMLALIIVVCMVAIVSVGESTNSAFDKVGKEIDKANKSTGS